MNAKNNILVRWDSEPKHIAFTIKRRAKTATVEYYEDYDVVETVECDINGADARWKQAMDSGYEVAF